MMNEVEFIPTYEKLKIKKLLFKFLLVGAFGFLVLGLKGGAFIFVFVGILGFILGIIEFADSPSRIVFRRSNIHVKRFRFSELTIPYDSFLYITGETIIFNKAEISFGYMKNSDLLLTLFNNAIAERNIMPAGDHENEKAVQQRIRFISILITVGAAVVWYFISKEVNNLTFLISLALLQEIVFVSILFFVRRKKAQAEKA